MKRYTIAIAVLPTTLTACADPIVGDWVGFNATYNSGDYSMDLPYEACSTVTYSYEGSYSSEDVCYMVSFALSIESDLTGAADLNLYGNNYNLPLTVEKQTSSSYTITLTEDGETTDLDCTLSDPQSLNCNFASLEYNVDFEK